MTPERDYTPSQLKELADKASRGDFMFADDELWDILRAHAAALEEVERVNAAWKAQQFHLEAEERESAHWQGRAEKAERKVERLKVHADRMRQILTIGDGGFPCRAVADYDAEFKGE